MLLVASETGHVYTFATRKLQPMITSESGKALIQTCLNSPDPAVNAVALDQRMSATGYEEPDLSYSSHEGVNVDKVGTFILYNNESFKLYFVLTCICIDIILFTIRLCNTKFTHLSTKRFTNPEHYR